MIDFETTEKELKEWVSPEEFTIARDIVKDVYDSVVPCGECIYFNKPNCTAYNYMNQYTPFDETGFCSDGEKKEIKH